jgi:acetate kinase
MPIVSKYIGSYTAVMNGLDAIIFTAGIGENSSYMRKLVCTDMDYFGIQAKNEVRSERTTRNKYHNLRLKFWSFRQMKSSK